MQEQGVDRPQVALPASSTLGLSQTIWIRRLVAEYAMNDSLPTETVADLRSSLTRPATHELASI